MGEIGLNYSDYIRLSVAHLQAIDEGYQIRKQLQDSNFRTLAWQLYNAFSDPKKRVVHDIKQFWKLDIDNIKTPETKKKKGKQLTMEQWQQFINRMKKAEA